MSADTDRVNADGKQMHRFRREIIRMAIRLIPDSVQMLLSHSYICVTFLIIYGTLWSLDMRIDISFFAVTTCLVTNLESAVMDFGFSIRCLVNYLTASKRMEVIITRSFSSHLISSL